MKLSQSKCEVKALNRIDDIYEIVFELQKEKKDGVSASEQQAKASVIYPANGLHCLILGETGVGKSMFAELMYRFAIESHIIPTDAPFITLVE
jgi:transcriptional regulator with AAA-type ATPase domain